MAVRTHGVIGGPKRKKSVRPKMKQGFFPKSTAPKVIVTSSKRVNKVDAVVVSSESDEMTHIPAEDKPKIIDLVAEETPLEEAPEASEEKVVVNDSDGAACPYCDFKAKSARGLKSHLRWRHATEAF